MILVIVNVEKHTNRIYWFSSCNTNSYMSDKFYISDLLV